MPTMPTKTRDPDLFFESFDIDSEGSHYLVSCAHSRAIKFMVEQEARGIKSGPIGNDFRGWVHVYVTDAAIEALIARRPQ